jgi:pyruvate, orthophosphate dikinase
VTATLTNQPAAATEQHQWVYLFNEGNAAMRNLLGGKGAGLAEMSNAGLPVPPGFTITTEACNSYYDSNKQFPPGMWEQAMAALRTVEQETGKKLGDPDNPLLVSVRSGSRVSMPGMMDTVLNLGLNAETLPGLIKQTNNERFGYDAYRRFIQMFGKIVLGIDAGKFEHILEAKKHAVGAKADTDLNSTDLQDVVKQYKALVKQETGKDFPEDPMQQLRLAIEAVFASWNNKRAVDYRKFNNIPDTYGTAVSVVSMVFGNMGDDSGTGVAFTRDPNTGEKLLYAEYLTNAQGEDVVAGIRTPKKIAELQRQMPEVYQQFADIAQKLERHYRDAQDLEFTVERGKLYMLQTRSAKRTGVAAVKIAVDMANEGLITKEEALQRVEPTQVYQLLLPRLDPKEVAKAHQNGQFLTKGLNASPGAASGVAVFDADSAAERGALGEKVILVRPETNPDDVHGMIGAQGVLTARGGATSHAAVVARGMGKPCVAGAEDIKVDPEQRRFTVNGVTVNAGEQVTIDGTTGEVFKGNIAVIDAQFDEQSELGQLLRWADETRKLGVWANADYPRDAERAIKFGAEGIGLCRTEHMFFEEERLPIVRQMILAAAPATALDNKLARTQVELDKADDNKQAATQQRLNDVQAEIAASAEHKLYYDALGKLQEFQRGDFYGILKAMAGKPVVIRLLDPPLHEFLPSYDELLVEVTELRVRGNDPKKLAEAERLLKVVEGLKEQNPMLGLRGVRLDILYPAIYEMQTRALMQAAAQLKREGVDVRPEIMIPLVGTAKELQIVRDQLTPVIEQTLKDEGTEVNYKFGTMIEIPRAALVAGEIAEYAQFFSFGTNDLTQMTFGYSRDDAEGKFLLQYVERGVLPVNPFQTLDRKGVGQLVRMAVEAGRAARPDLKVGICGEHGGDPDSIEFCNSVGLNYVSCSPFRVPIARLAAAQAVLASVERDK